MAKVFTTLLVLFSFILNAQDKQIQLVEEKLKKRTILYVQNDSDVEKSVFLKVNPVGYRRSAQRPLIKKIPAKSKVQMLILIPLLDQESHYTYHLVVNKKIETLDIAAQKSQLE